ncbi:hypothetical protein [Paenibacillus paridis]|uniref:hypothetical protein n=1 Tax=Paenibacillus paridis TaxID=2583376 RepID=UPI00111EF6C5|nr:hypothetical protein [Paenibacillus paridis]
MQIKLNGSKPSLSQGQIIFISAIALVVVLNVAALFLYLLPELDSLKQAKQGVEGQKQTLESVRNDYTDEKITDEQLEKLTNRVPVVRDDSNNLIFFYDVGQLSEAPPTLITQSSGAEEGQSAETDAAGSGTVTTSFEVTVVGHLPNLLSYIDNLHHYERLYTLQKWSLTELTKEAANQEYPDLYSHPFIKKDKPLLTLRMSIQAYYFPQFKDAFNKQELEKGNAEQTA